MKPLIDNTEFRIQKAQNKDLHPYMYRDILVSKVKKAPLISSLLVDMECLFASFHSNYTVTMPCRHNQNQIRFNTTATTISASGLIVIYIQEAPQ